MSKSINLPACSWFNSKFFLEKVMTNNHIINHIFIICASFICRAPSTICKFKSTLLNKHFNLILNFLWLSVVPHSEELHFNIGKLTSWFFQKFFYNSCQNQVNSSMLRILICTRIVLVNCFNPSNIIMCMSK